MTHTWEQWEGISLAGVYGLEQWLGSDPSGAFFLTSYGPDGERAILKLTGADGSAGEDQLAPWQRTAELRHPNLMALLDCGRVDSGGESFLYAVFEAPDDSLTAAIQNGPLNEDEARDVFGAAVDALRYLHERGWAHTSIDSEHVVAVGDRIKLSSDTLQEAPSGGEAQSSDVWALGALVYELVTGRRIEPGRFAAVSGISDPLGTMIQQSTEPDVRDRWTAAQLSQRLNPEPVGQAFSPVLEPQEPAPEPPAPIEEALTPDPAEPEPRPPAIVVHEPFSLPEPEEAAPEPLSPPEPSITRYVPIAAIGAIALLAIIFVIAHHGTSPPPAVAIVPPPVAEPVAPVVPVSVPKAPLQTWRVISYTYLRYEDAQKKAEFINGKYRDIHAEVFTLKTKPPSYLISLGAHLTREDAEALRRRALAKGLPRDTFIRNFAE